MNPRESTRTFEAARRQHLIEATIDALAEVGFKAASLSQIARRADVSTGLFAHYFNDKDGLLEATLRFMAARLALATRLRLKQATSARERLYAVPDAALADTEFERRTSAVWLAFWGQITHSARYQRVQIIYQRRMISNLRHDLRALVPRDCVDIYATIIASLIDGLWLRSHVAPAVQENAAEARRTVRLLIDKLLDGDPSGPRATPDRRAPLAVRPATRSEAGREEPRWFVPARGPDIAAAIARARVGVDAWRSLSHPDRSERLRGCAASIRRRCDALADLMAQHEARPIRRTRQDISRAAQALIRAGGLISCGTQMQGRCAPSLHTELRQGPIGIVALSAPGHQLLSDSLRRLAPALAVGNAIILQTGPTTWETFYSLVQMFEADGLPSGLVTVVRGDRETAQLVETHPDIGFADRDVTPKSTTVVFADADLPKAAQAILRGPRPWTPTCDWSEDRIFVERRAHEALRTHLVALAEDIRYGDPLDMQTEIGPLRSNAHLDIVLSAIDAAVDCGASLASGGVRRSGHGLAPTVVDGCRPSMTLVDARLYAPVVTLIPFEGETELARSLDASGSLGLICGNADRAYRLAARLPFRACGITDLSEPWDDSAIASWDEAVPVVNRYLRRSRLVMRSNRFGLSNH